jgi:hypothetical protein
MKNSSTFTLERVFACEEKYSFGKRFRYVYRIFLLIKEIVDNG